MNEQTGTRRRAAQLLILALGLAALIAGLARGEGAQALQRGLRVCLECVGIG